MDRKVATGNTCIFCNKVISFTQPGSRIQLNESGEIESICGVCYNKAAPFFGKRVKTNDARRCGQGCQQKI